MAKFSDLLGETLVKITQNDDDELIFETKHTKYRMWHWQDCCESVTIESVVGDFDDLLGTPILHAEEAESSEPPAGTTPDEYGSETWTFYKLRTIKGSVDIRWHGSSNGYYSESVDFEEIT